MKWKKALTGLLVACLSMNILTGCKNTDETSKQKKVAMGRYVEKNIAMPELVESGEEIAYIMSEYQTGRPELYAYNLKENKTYQYRMKEDETWEKKDPKWLDAVAGELHHVAYDEKGACYPIFAKASEDANEDMDIKVMKVKENQSAQEYMKDDGKAKGADTNTPYAEAVLKEGSLLLLHHESLDVYRDGVYQSSIEAGGKSFSYTNDQIVLTDLKKDCIDFVNPETGNVERQIEFPHIRDEKVIYGKDSKDNVYFVIADGVYRIVKEGSTVEKIMEASKTSLNQPALSPCSLIVNEDAEFYILYEGEQGKRVVKKYYYDSSVPTLPEKSLTIVSLYNSDTIRQVINAYEKEHPDIWVDYQVLLNDDNEELKKEVINQLNTDLIAGNGADLLVLDGLPIDTYIEKEVLKDLSNDLKPYLDEKKLLPNIVEPSKVDGKLYGVPARIGLCYGYGDAQIMKNLDSIESLTDAMSKQSLPLVSEGNMPIQLLAEWMYDYYSYEFVLGKSIDATRLTEYLNCMKQISKNIDALGEEYADVYYGMDAKTLNYIFCDSLYHKKSLMGMCILKDMYDGFEAVYVNDYIKGETTDIHNQYLTLHQIGINSASMQQELAGQFLQMVYSKELQKVHTGDGFPVNVEALEGYEMEDDDYCICSEDYKAVQLKDKTPYQRILDYCAEVEVPIVTDYNVKKAVVEGTVKFLEGEDTVESVVDSIMLQLEIYLKE